MERYQHFRGGRYQVLMLAEKEDTGEQLVIYQALYGDNKIYARSLSSFLEELDPARYPDAVQRFRFQRMDENGVPEESGQNSAADVHLSESSGEDQLPAQDLTVGRLQNEKESDQRQQENAVVNGSRNPQKETASEAAAEPASNEAHSSEVEAAGAEVKEEPALDPMLERFLDARTTQDRLTVLDEMRGRVTDSMIDTMALASDVEVKPGPLQLRYEDLHDCLLTIQRYELERGRLRG